MNVLHIRSFLEALQRDKTPVDSSFKFDRYQGERHEGEVKLVTNDRYMPRLAQLIAQLKPKRLLTIGALFGTSESYLLQCCGGREFLETITICDLDIEDYNPNRDNGSLIYRNICGTQYGAFQGVFTHFRGGSRWPEVRRRVAGCAPYDLVFVDGEHSAEAVYDDNNLAAECLAPGGTILVHDTSLMSSSVPAGWDKWCKDHNPEWVCDAVPEEVFLLGLGYAQRLTDQ